MPTLEQDLSRYQADLHDANELLFVRDRASDEGEAERANGIKRGHTTTGSRRTAVVRKQRPRRFCA